MKVSITPMSSTARVRKWREANREHFRAYQRDWKRRKRGSKLLNPQREGGLFGRVVAIDLPPEGYDPAIDGDLADWKRRKGLK